MKVLMLSIDRSILLPGSPSFRRMADYAARLSELHIVVNAPFRPFLSRSFLPANLFIYPTGNRFRAGYFFRAYRLGARIIRSRAFSALHDAMTAQDSFPTGIIAYALRCRFGVPFQLQAHIDFFSPYFSRESLFQRVQAACFRLLLPRADSIRAVSDALRRHMTDVLRIDPSRIQTLPVFSDVPAISCRAPSRFLRDRHPSFDFIALLPARFVKQKNIPMAIRAAAILCDRYPRIGFVIVGAGPEKACLRLLARAASPCIAFEPWTDDPCSLYLSADMFLLTSWYEGWGRTVMDAMAAGLPVAATAVGCVPETVADGVSGFLIPFDDHAALASIIERLYLDTALRRTVAIAGRAAALRRMPGIADDYADDYADGIRMAPACRTSSSA